MRRPACFGEDLAVAGVQAGRIGGRPLDEVGPVGQGAPQCGVPAPALDDRVVAGEQNVRDVAPAPGPRPRVDRALQPGAASPAPASDASPPNESSLAERSLPSTPGSSRPIASTMTRTATSPPAST